MLFIKQEYSDLTQGQNYGNAVNEAINDAVIKVKTGAEFDRTKTYKDYFSNNNNDNLKAYIRNFIP